MLCVSDAAPMFACPIDWHTDNRGFISLIEQLTVCFCNYLHTVSVDRLTWYLPPIIAGTVLRTESTDGGDEDQTDGGED
jgi:hypothetical protein